MKKMIAMLLALVMALSLAACGEKANDGSTDNDTAKTELVLGTSADYAPFEFMYPDDSGEMVYGGIDVSVAKYIADEMGLTLQVENMGFDYLLTSLDKGDFDIVLAAMEATPDRLENADFSDPYYEVVQAVVLPAGTNIKSLADLKGKKVGGQIGTTGIFVMRKADVGADLKEYDDVGLAIQDMVGGRLDAVICDSPVAMYYVNKKADYAGKLNLSFKTDDKEYYGFTVRKGRQDLVDKLNKGIKQVKESGLEAKLIEKWMGTGK